MKPTEIMELSTREIEERIDTEKNMLTRLKLGHSISPLDNPMKIKEYRKDIARLRTELRKRQLNEKKKS
jgi:large subunit ribosomal protein L29